MAENATTKKPAATKRPGRARKKPADHLEQDRAKLLKAALPHVPFDGWSLKAMRGAADATGIDHGRMRLAFPNGVASLIDYFCEDGDRRMSAALAKKDLPSMKVRERIKTAVRTRFEVDAANREAVRRGATFMALPFNAGTAARALYRTVDAMWRAAGDTSTDYNFYTKRAILSAVYSSTLIYWVSDESKGSKDTWTFLDRRIDDVMQIEKVKAQVQKVGEMLPDPLALLGRLRYPPSQPAAKR